MRTTKVTTRRLGFRALLTCIAATLALVGCGTESGPEPDSAPSAAAGDGYPATVDTVHGPVTVEEVPERIVVLQRNLAELLVALDVQPAVLFAGEAATVADAEAANPWMDGVYDDSLVVDPTLAELASTASVEAIAVHEPDLIIGTDANIDPRCSNSCHRSRPPTPQRMPAGRTGRCSWPTWGR